MADYNVVKGFLNIEVDPKVWNSVLAAIVSDDNFGITEAGPDSPLVMVEYSSPNVLAASAWSLSIPEAMSFSTSSLRCELKAT